MTPDTLILRGGRLPYFVVFALSFTLFLGFLALPFVLIDPRSVPFFVYVFGGLLVIFSGWGSVAGFLGLVRGHDLLLTREGFKVNGPFSPRFYRWRDVERFETNTEYLPDQESVDVVTFYVASSYKGPRRREGLDTDYAGIDAGELAALLNEWRERHAGPPTSRRPLLPSSPGGSSTGQSFEEALQEVQTLAPARKDRAPEPYGKSRGARLVRVSLGVVGLMFMLYGATAPFVGQITICGRARVWCSTVYAANDPFWFWIIVAFYLGLGALIVAYALFPNRL